MASTICFFFFFKHKSAYELLRSLVGSEMCIRDRVYLKAEPDKTRIVSGYLVRQKSVTYGLAGAGEETWHQEVEIEKLPGKVVVKGFKK